MKHLWFEKQNGVYIIYMGDYSKGDGHIVGKRKSKKGAARLTGRLYHQNKKSKE